ncbi:hypothetical protein MMC06_005929 [Schaereria dolodes]|nr:hypothetical protein [Schaereria dolodes]
MQAIFTSVLLIFRFQPKTAWFKALKIILWITVCAYLSYQIVQANHDKAGSVSKLRMRSYEDFQAREIASSFDSSVEKRGFAFHAPETEAPPPIDNIGDSGTDSTENNNEDNNEDANNVKESGDDAKDNVDKVNWSVIACAVFDGLAA